jgi:hypothetical protein
LTHPSEITAETIDVFAVANLRVYGHSTVGACVGILSPRVYVDRAVQLKPGFESLMFHEGTHAYERHRFAGLLIAGSGVAGFSVGLVYWLPLMAMGVVSAALWVRWCKRMEIRADAVALFGAGYRDFYSFLRLVGKPRTRWGKWCYGKSFAARTGRATRECHKRGWDVTA